MFCHRCGQENQEQAQYCAKCGVALTAPGQQPATRPNWGITQAEEYAGFWRRFAAALIDGFLLQLVILPAWYLLQANAGQSEEAASRALILISVVYVTVAWIYEALLESSQRQATLGKMALGIVVTDTAGKRITFGRATGRHFGKILSALILCIGYIMAGFTKRKQALHDVMAGCLVVQQP